SGASEDIVAAMTAVRHPNFTIWYDAGNIIYYTGKDPVEELKPIAEHVTGFCAKDCAALKSDVMIQFGTGKVDFAAVFATLKAAGFDGPIMVECCKIGATAEETTANARANRTFLETGLACVQLVVPCSRRCCAPARRGGALAGPRRAAGMPRQRGGPVRMAPRTQKPT